MTPSPDDYARADKYAHLYAERFPGTNKELDNLARCFIATRKELAEARAALERVRGRMPTTQPNIGAPTNEPSLRVILAYYYRQAFDKDEAERCADLYLAALSRALQGGG